ncbi:MAG: rod-binding protein [Planctomycetes bacterium]|nr:rod-binding protein [Planctomycetota bacterium]
MIHGAQLNSALSAASTVAPLTTPIPEPPKAAAGDDRAVREAFDSFVGEAFYGQMLKAMRKTLGKPAYFHGGQAEEIFQGQLDQVLSEKLTAAGAKSITEPMYQLFALGRPN